jgi:hypothetical protein
MSGYNGHNTGLLGEVSHFKIQGKTLTNDKWSSCLTINESREYFVLRY